MAENRKRPLTHSHIYKRETPTWISKQEDSSNQEDKQKNRVIKEVEVMILNNKMKIA